MGNHGLPSTPPPRFPCQSIQTQKRFSGSLLPISSSSSTLTETAPNVPRNPTLSTAPLEARPASLSPAPPGHLLPAPAAPLPLPPDCHSLAESSPQSALLITAVLCLKPLMAAFMCSTKASLAPLPQTRAHTRVPAALIHSPCVPPPAFASGPPSTMPPPLEALSLSGRHCASRVVSASTCLIQKPQAGRALVKSAVTNTAVPELSHLYRRGLCCSLALAELSGLCFEHSRGAGGGKDCAS